jgi:hypothetical protein
VAGVKRPVCRAFTTRASSDFALLAPSRSHQGRTRSNGRRRVHDHGLGVTCLPAFVAAGFVAIVLPDREPMTVTDA